MPMTPRIRKLALTTHITTSVGWIGAVVAYLALVIAAMTNSDVQILRAVWIAMKLIGWYALIPLSLVSLLTGLIMSLGTKWGLFRHYWVLFSLVLTTFATVILIQHMQTVNSLAAIAAEMNVDNVGGLREGLGGELFHAGVGLLLLIAVQVMNVYKPRGMTAYGWRQQQSERNLSSLQAGD
ncbi:MAG: DUF2269 domain-containing protein [Anaerolineae bacterium]|nr:DUF2269 domain-containing protein [Anaerolineae bacterium]